MDKKTARREQIIDRLSVHLLEHGLEDSGLRSMAQAVGTSDRMLLYYFENKEELLGAVLTQISSGLADDLGRVFGTDPIAPHRLLVMLWETLKGEDLAPQLRLWLDLSSRASRGDPLYGAVVAEISASWIAWMSGIVDVEKAQKRALATLIMGAMDGQSMLFPQDLSSGDPAIELLAELLAKQTLASLCSD